MVQEIEGLKESLTSFRTQYMEKNARMAELSANLVKVCNEIETAWSGSYLDTHWDLYYKDFEQPAVGRTFNIEWGLVNGLPDGWHQYSGTEVEAEIQRRLSSKIILEEFKKEVDDLVELAEGVREECRLVCLSLSDSKEDMATGLCKRIVDKDVAFDANTHVGNLVLGGARTRDSRAISSGRRGTPVHTYYGAFGMRGSSIVKLGEVLIKDAERLISYLEGADKRVESITGSEQNNILRIIDNFDIVARQIAKRHDNRDTIVIGDEYDVQDLFESLLRIFFEDVRAEEYIPSTAGAGSRVDFLLVTDQAAVEIKFASKNQGKTKLRDELLVDIAIYKKHPDIKILYCFTYDANGFVQNPRGFEKDITDQSDDQLEVLCYVRPK